MNLKSLIFMPAILLILTTVVMADTRLPTKPLKERVNAAETVFVGKLINRVEDGDWVRADLLVETPLHKAKKDTKVQVTWRKNLGSRVIYDAAEGTKAIAILGDKYKERYWLRADKFESVDQLDEVKAIIKAAAEE